MKKLLAYAKRRLFEPSTYMGMVGIIGSISIMPEPWKWFALAMGIFGISISDNAIKQWANTPPQ